MAALVAEAVASAVAGGHELVAVRMEVAVRASRLGVVAVLALALVLVLVLVLALALALALAVTVGAGLAMSSERTSPSTFEV
jgi:hypothetical protein